MLVKYGFLTGLGLLIALAAMWLIEPQTIGGQALIIIIVLALVNGIGTVTWWTKL